MSITNINHLDAADFELQVGQLNPETGLSYIPYPSEGDEVPESYEQFALVVYLTNLLRWLYNREGWLVVGNLCIRKTRQDKHPLIPDVAVFKVKFNAQNKPNRLKTWKMWESDRPAPFVVFEISSDDTWRLDLKLEEKPSKYLDLGVQEYFAYDPNDPPYWKDGKRLRGWSYKNAKVEEIVPNTQGWLWSEELNSWLEPDGEYLRLRDKQGQRRLTEAESERAAKLEAQAENARVTKRSESDRAALETLLTKLRANNIDPDKL